MGPVLHVELLVMYFSKQEGICNVTIGTADDTRAPRAARAKVRKL